MWKESIVMLFLIDISLSSAWPCINVHVFVAYGKSSPIDSPGV